MADLQGKYQKLAAEYSKVGYSFAGVRARVRVNMVKKACQLACLYHRAV